MPFECRSCGRIEEQRLRRPPDCPTKDLCDLRAVQTQLTAEPLISPPGSAASLVSPPGGAASLVLPPGGADSPVLPPGSAESPVLPPGSAESPVLPTYAELSVSAEHLAEPANSRAARTPLTAEPPVNAEHLAASVNARPFASSTALESFSDIAAIARARLAATVAHDEAEVPAAPSAALLIGNERFELRSDMILGRNGNVGFAQMRSDTTVSREHARVRCRNGRWSIENVARSNNALRVSGRVIGFGASHELALGRNAVVMGERFEVQIVIG